MFIEYLKKKAALAALKYINPNIDILGIGTGSTVSYFINALNLINHKIKGIISSSKISSLQINKLNIPILNLNNIKILPLYIDGADEINYNLQMIKGGGAALTKEKIIASVASIFICIIDETKLVNNLGKNVPLPIEVIPMARSFVMKTLLKFGKKVIYRKNILTDNGNIIIDLYSLLYKDLFLLERDLNNIPGVVTVGLFAHRSADILIISSKFGIKTIYNKSFNKKTLYLNKNCALQDSNL